MRTLASQGAASQGMGPQGMGPQGVYPGRRDCLKLGLGAMLGGGFVQALGARALGAAAGPAQERDFSNTRCILFWLDGGPSHFETFDPKPDAPVEIRGQFGSISTKVPGMHFSEVMPKLASVSDKVTIVRSLCHEQNLHGAGNHYMMTGAPVRVPANCGIFVSFHPSMGSVVSAERGAASGLPPYVTMPSMTRSGGPNFLGTRHAPFVLSGDPNLDTFRVRDVALPRELESGRELGRRELRAAVDRFTRYHERAASDPVLGADQNFQQAVSLMTSEAAQAAFQIHREPDAMRDAYGRHSLGQRALLARRLVEAGVPFVTVALGGSVWDHHAQIFKAFQTQGREFDAVLGTLIQDLDDRGLLENTLVLAMGEFGRTPQVNPDAGRDHWSSAMSILVAGCGTPRGQIVGATDARGFAPIDQRYGPENLVSTVYRKLGIDPAKIMYTSAGRPTHLVDDPRPIPELM